jgi:hypothetical protein
MGFIASSNASLKAKGEEQGKKKYLKANHYSSLLFL